MELRPFPIYLWNNFIVIENPHSKKRVSIEKNTLKIRADFPSLNESMKEAKRFNTKGVLGVVQFDSQYCLLYILENRLVGRLNKAEIYQVNDVSYIPLSTTASDFERLSLMLNSFTSMMRKGFFYYSTSYDLTNTYLSQRSYLYYKTCKHDYLWNDNLLARFIEASIEVEQFFVFAICGFVQCYLNNVSGKSIQCALIARKKLVFYQDSNTQLETIILYSNTSAFAYIIKSFCYENDFNQSKETKLKVFQTHYSQYNCIKKTERSKTFVGVHSAVKGNNSNMIIHILERNNKEGSDSVVREKLEEMSGIIIETFDKLQYIQLNYKENFSGFKAFVSGIRNLIKNSGYTLLIHKTQNDLLGFDIDDIFQAKKSFLQKTFAIIISLDEKAIVEFERHLLWEVLREYFSQYQLPPQQTMTSNCKKQEKGRSTIAMNVNSEETLGSGIEFQNVCLANIDAAFKLYLGQIAMKDNKSDYVAMESFILKDAIVNQIDNTLINGRNNEKPSAKLNIFISTWNVGAIKDLESIDLSLVFSPHSHSAVISSNPPHIFTIALQEIVKLSTKKVLFQSNDDMVSNWVAKIEEALPGYKFIKHVSLVGLLLLVFISEPFVDKISFVSNHVIKTGFFGTLGNKGCCCVVLSYLGKLFSFAAVHLASGSERNENRIKDLTTIVKSSPDANSLQLYDNDIWFVFGDFNFRLDLDKNNIKLLLKAKSYENLKANDQLISYKTTFDFDYMEEEIKFKPTYKFDSNNNYSEKQTPSWCDRIIFKPSSKVKPLVYDSCELLFSDHKPVIGLFEVSI